MDDRYAVAAPLALSCGVLVLVAGLFLALAAIAAALLFATAA